MDAARLDIKHSLLSIAARPAGLFGNEGNWVGFIEQP
jgi:hypothetical protein